MHCVAACTVLLLAGLAPQHAVKPEIDAGFRLLYELHFDEARAKFEQWQKSHADDPMGPAALAASYLFQEFYRQGVLTSEFFLDDKKLLVGIEGKPDPDVRASFLNAIDRAQVLAKARLGKEPQDVDALLVMTITTGMRSNYLGVIEKEHLESLKLTKKAETYAKALLKIEPDAGDPYVALGASNYIIGSLPGYKRFFLWFGGIKGDREEGMRQLKIAASRGHYLRPYAKIMLALAALREKETDVARTQLTALVAEFPENALFSRELALLEKKSGERRGDP